MSWLLERQKIEERIREVRRNQQKSDLEELERLRKNAADQRGRLGILMSACLGLVGLVLGVMTTLPLTRALYVFRYETPLTAAVIVGIFTMILLGGAGAVTWQWRIFESRRLVELESEVSSVEDLDRLARGAANQHYGERLLLSSNPHLRYAGAYAAEDRPLSLHALEAERATLVRRAIARRLGHLGPLPIPNLSFKTTPELAYLIEAAALDGSVDPADLPSLPRSLMTLAMIASRARGKFADYLDDLRMSGSSALKLAISRLDVRSKADESLKRAYESGLSSDLSYPDISQREIEYAVRELSPFEEGGLGTFDDLESIAEIDQFYLFFRQLAFEKERGLVAPR